MRIRKSLVAISAVCAMLVTGSVVWAQSAGRDSCVDACEQAEARCIDACGTHDNPVECEEKCQDTAEACSRQCR